VGTKPLRLLVRNGPSPLGRFSRTPFAKGVLEAAFLWYLSFAEAKESTRKSNRFQQNNISIPKTIFYKIPLDLCDDFP